MIAPAPAPLPFFPSPLAIDTTGLGSQGPLLDLEAAAGPAGPEFPPFKKPRNSDAVTLNPIQSPPFNPRMAPPMPPPPMNKTINKMFFKTRLCAKFKLGTCPYGSNCNFAHGVEEVRKPPANWQEIVAAHEDEIGVGSRAEQHRISRLGICRKFYNGEGCPYGDRCNFLHEDPERVREGMTINTGAAMTASAGTKGGALDHAESGGLVSSGGDGSWSSTKGVLWKTRMCNKWEMTGQCPFGEKCHFAHGSAELQKFTSLHMEAEGGNAVVVPCKPLLGSGSSVSPSKVDSFCKLQAEGRKPFPRWKGHEKISGIYGDWIDDIRLPNKVQS
ncbi:hypothetical protein ACLOJK_031961 [Asimina triloba]